MVEAMVYILRTGCPWRDLPTHFGPWSSVYTRWYRWAQNGLWASILDALSEDAESSLRHLDSSHVKVHQDKQLLLTLSVFSCAWRSFFTIRNHKQATNRAARKTESRAASSVRRTALFGPEIAANLKRSIPATSSQANALGKDLA